LGRWLDDRGVEDAWTLAPALIETGFDLAKLKHIASTFPAEAVGVVLRRVASSLLVERLLDELDSSTTRVTELVRVIKEYSFMDRDGVQDVDIHQGLESTLLMLRHRLKHGVKIVREYDPALPHLRAHGGELNQVWTNLIDNAVDAMQEQGELRIRTARDPNGVLIEITDSGPGVPPEIQHRIFDPFFTTKEVGQGTGLGLDTVARIVRTHRGTVRLQSRPGETTFQVWLPIEGGGNA
jgi:signal transduction histidine kinase